MRSIGWIVGAGQAEMDVEAVPGRSRYGFGMNEAVAPVSRAAARMSWRARRKRSTAARGSAGQETDLELPRAVLLGELMDRDAGASRSSRIRAPSGHRASSPSTVNIRLCRRRGAPPGPTPGTITNSASNATLHGDSEPPPGVRPASRAPPADRRPMAARIVCQPSRTPAPRPADAAWRRACRDPGRPGSPPKSAPNTGCGTCSSVIARSQFAIANVTPSLRDRLETSARHRLCPTEARRSRGTRPTVRRRRVPSAGPRSQRPCRAGRAIVRIAIAVCMSWRHSSGRPDGGRKGAEGEEVSVASTTDEPASNATRSG